MSILKIEEDENSCAKTMRGYIAFHENLTSTNVVLMPRYFDRTARYQAPLADISGKDSIARFWAIRRARYDDYKLKVRQTWWHDSGQVAFLRWEFVGKRGNHTISFSGYSEITLTLEGKILSHIDTYDPFVGALHWPVIGEILRALRKRSI